MIPRERGGGKAREATCAVVVDGQDATIDYQLEETLAVTTAVALDKMLAMVDDLS